MQVETQATTVVVKALREADLTTELHTRRNRPEKPHRPRQAGPTLTKPAFH